MVCLFPHCSDTTYFQCWNQKFLCHHRVLISPSLHFCVQALILNDHFLKLGWISLLLHSTTLKIHWLPKLCSVLFTCLPLCLDRLICFWWNSLTCLLLIDIEGKCSYLGGHVVLFLLTFYLLFFLLRILTLAVAYSCKYTEYKGILSLRWPVASLSLESEVNYKTRLMQLVGIDCLYFSLVVSPLTILFLCLCSTTLV